MARWTTRLNGAHVRVTLTLTYVDLDMNVNMNATVDLNAELTSVLVRVAAMPVEDFEVSGFWISVENLLTVIAAAALCGSGQCPR
jgi:hypothetical protein